MSKVYILFDVNYYSIYKETYLNEAKAEKELLKLQNRDKLRYGNRYKWIIRELELNTEESKVNPLVVEPGGEAEGTEIMVELFGRRKRWDCLTRVFKER